MHVPSVRPSGKTTALKREIRLRTIFRWQWVDSKAEQVPTLEIFLRTGVKLADRVVDVLAAGPALGLGGTGGTAAPSRGSQIQQG